MLCHLQVVLFGFVKRERRLLLSCNSVKLYSSELLKNTLSTTVRSSFLQIFSDIFFEFPCHFVALVNRIKHIPVN